MRFVSINNQLTYRINLAMSEDLLDFYVLLEVGVKKALKDFDPKFVFNLGQVDFTWGVDINENFLI